MVRSGREAPLLREALKRPQEELAKVGSEHGGFLIALDKPVDGLGDRYRHVTPTAQFNASRNSFLKKINMTNAGSMVRLLVDAA